MVNQELTDFKVRIFEEEYIVQSQSRAKAIAQAINLYREGNPSSVIPTTVLRGLARCSAIDSIDLVTKDMVEKAFGGK
jgi:hypothetical protein